MRSAPTPGRDLPEWDRAAASRGTCDAMGATAQLLLEMGPPVWERTLSATRIAPSRQLSKPLRKMTNSAPGSSPEG